MIWTFPESKGLTRRDGLCYHQAKSKLTNGCDGDEYAASLRRSESGMVEAGHAEPPKIPPEPLAERRATSMWSRASPPVIKGAALTAQWACVAASRAGQFAARNRGGTARFALVPWDDERFYLWIPPIQAEDDDRAALLSG